MNFPSLFSPGTIGVCSLKNRIIMPLYPTKYATDSRVNGKMLEFYRARVRGGVGLIVLDCPCLDYPRAYKGPHELRIDRPEYSDTVVELLKAVHDEGARAFMQLNYPKERAFDHEVPVVAIAKINTPELAEEIIGQGGPISWPWPGRWLPIRNCPTRRRPAARRQSGVAFTVWRAVRIKGWPGIGRCCLVNPFAGHEYDWPVKPASVRKKVLVVGGGPAGMQAAIIADLRGHDVELWEQDRELGGQIRLAHLAPYKEEMVEALRYLRYRLAAGKVTVRFGRRATAAAVIAHGPDVVVAACGSVPARPPIPGLEGAQVYHAREIYARRTPLGRRLVIIGGGDLGCETADWLAAPDREVTVVEILADVLRRMKKIPRQRLLARLAAKGVTVLTETRLDSVAPGADHIIGKNGRNRTLATDNVIVAVGAASENRLQTQLNGTIAQILAVGDADIPGNLGAALRSGTEAVLAI